MKLWEGLEQDLNYNAMVSQRGVLNLYHSDAQRDAYARRGNAMRIHGVDAELLDATAVQKMLPFLDFDNARFPVQGGLLQRRGGTARHDAVVWGYARAAERARRRHHPELRSHRLPQRRRRQGRPASRPRAARSAPARSAWRWPATPRASPRWPACACRSKAMCCRPSSPKAIKPLIPGVITFGAGHFYVSQSDKGGLVFGGDIDGYNSYAQRGNLPMVEDVCEGGMALMPMIGRVRLLRQWGGIMDMSMDGSPIIDKTPVDGLYLNAGWCYGGFKATPASGLSSPICWPATNRTRQPRAFRLDRFQPRRCDRRKGPGRPAEPALRIGH